MIPKEVILKAIDGGWLQGTNHFDPEDDSICTAYPDSDTPDRLIGKYEIALDPTFWQALGRALGWGDTELENGIEPFAVLWYLFHAHRFFDLILTGRDTTQFWSDLLCNKE